MNKVLGSKEQSENTASINTSLDFTEQVSEEENSGEALPDGKKKKNPFKSGSEKKKKKSKESDESDKPKKISKKTIIISAVVVFILGVLIFISTRDKSDYFSLLKQTINEDGGAFKYTITVSTPTDIEKDETNTDISDGKHGQSIKNEWLDSSNAQVVEWDSPNYMLSITGQTFSLNPYEAYYLLELKTQYVNSELLEVYVKDGMYYLDLSYLYDTLNDSQDVYLMTLAKSLETQRGIIKVSAENFKFSNLFTDDVSTINLYESKEQLCSLITTLLTEIQNTTDGVKKVDDNSFTFKVSDAASTVNRLKTLAQNSGDIYRQVYPEASDREIANVINAFSDVNTYFQVKNDMKLTFEGQASKYTSGTGNQTYECVLNTTAEVDDKKYKVNITCTRSSEQLKIEASKYAAAIEIKDTNFLDAILKDLANYLNPTSINTYNNDTTKTFENLSEHIKLEFIDMVNETGLVKVYRSTLDDFLKDYMKYDDDKDTLKKLVTTYTSLYNLDAEIEDTNDNKSNLEAVLKSGTTIKLEHVPVNNAKYSKFTITVSGLTDSGKELNLTELSLKDKYDNIYPANNTVLLTGVLDVELTTTVTEDGVYELYFLTEDLRNLQLYYNKDNLGTIDIK